MATVYVHAITMKNGNELDKYAINLEGKKDTGFNFYPNLFFIQFYLLYTFKCSIQNQNPEFERKNFSDKIHKKGSEKLTEVRLN